MKHTVVSLPTQTIPSSGTSSSTPTVSAPRTTSSPELDTLSSADAASDQPSSSASDWGTYASWLPGPIPGCTSTQTAVVFGSTSLIPRPCLSGGNGPASMPNQGNGGHFSLIPHPQSSVASLGGIEEPGHVGSGGASGGDAGSPTTTTAMAATTQALPSSIPVELPKPVSKPTPIRAKSTSTAAQPSSTDVASNPIVAGGGGGRGGIPLPRPESTVQGLEPVNTGATAHPTTSTAQHTKPQSGFGANGGANIPTGQDTATFLGLPGGVGGPTKIPYQPQPVKASALPPGIISVGSTALTADSSSNFVIGSQTLAPGSAPITHSGIVYSLPSSGTGVVIGPSTHSILVPTPQSAPIITLGGSTLTADSSSRFYIGSQTLAPGGTIIQSSQVVSLAPNAATVIIGSQTQQLSHQPFAPASTPIITIGGSTITANSASHFKIGSQTLVPGGAAITNPAGQTVSLAAGGSSVVVDGQTQQVSQQVATPAPVITVGNSRITANSQSQFVVGSQTLAAGASAITVSNQVISLASSGNAVVFGQRTQAINAASQFVATQAPILTLDQATFTANSKSEYIVADQTLHAGSSAIIVSGSTISLAPSAAAVVVNGKTASLTPHSVIATVAPPVITVGPSAVTAVQSGKYVIAGQTLSAGGRAITVSGTRISLGSDASNLVVGSSTQHLSPQILELTTQAPVLTVGKAHISAVAPSEYVYGGKTFEAGDMMTISGTIVSFAADDSYVEIGASTSMIPKSDYIFGTQMLEPGHAITVSGTVISLASDDSYLKIGTSTERLHGHTVIKSTAVRSTGSTTARSSVSDFITGSLVQAAQTGAASPSASPSTKSVGDKGNGGSRLSFELGLVCGGSVALAFLLL